jgi:hypothetical protein
VKSLKNQREEARRFTWYYRHSLFLAFLLLFVLSLALHVVVGGNAYNEELALAGQPLTSVAAFFAFSQILVVHPANLAGGISGNCSLCGAQHLPASIGLSGIEAGRIQGPN